jgi:hypothetical protein
VCNPDLITQTRLINGYEVRLSMTEGGPIWFKYLESALIGILLTGSFVIPALLLMNLIRRPIRELWLISFLSLFPLICYIYQINNIDQDLSRFTLNYPKSITDVFIKMNELIPFPVIFIMLIFLLFLHAEFLAFDGWDESKNDNSKKVVIRLIDIGIHRCMLWISYPFIFWLLASPWTKELYALYELKYFCNFPKLTRSNLSIIFVIYFISMLYILVPLMVSIKNYYRYNNYSKREMITRTLLCYIYTSIVISTLNYILHAIYSPFFDGNASLYFNNAYSLLVHSSVLSHLIYYSERYSIGNMSIILIGIAHILTMFIQGSVLSLMYKRN